MVKELPTILDMAEWHDRLPRYASVAELVAGKRVLDVGCGSGEGAALLAEAGAREVVAIDPSGAMIDEAARRFPLPNLVFLARYVEDPLDLGSSHVELENGEAGGGSEPNQTGTDWRPVDPEIGEVPTEPSEQAPAVQTGAVEDGTTEQLEVPARDADRAPADAAPDGGDAAEPRAEAVSTGTSEKFDLILAFNPGLPIQSRDFLERLAGLLAPDGCVIASVRVNGRPGFADLLSAFEGGADSNEPITFASMEAMEQAFGAVFGHVRQYAQYGAMSTRFVPAEASTQREAEFDHIIGGATEAVPRFRIVAMGMEEPVVLPRVKCYTPLESLVSKLVAGAEGLVVRTLGLEHRGLVYEEQISQKDHLIDDLEREVRASNSQARELEAQVHALRAELDGLQAELTAPMPPALSRDADRLADERERRLAMVTDELEHVRLVAGTLREALEAQRETISALQLRLELYDGRRVPTVPSPSGVVSRAEAEERAAEVAVDNTRVQALEAALAAVERERDVLQQKLAHQTSERSQAAKSAEQASEQASERAALLQRELESTRRELTQLKSEHTTLSQGQGSASARIGELEAAVRRAEARTQEQGRELEGLREERDSLRQQVARFRRGRRMKRAGLDSETLASGTPEVPDRETP